MKFKRKNKQELPYFRKPPKVTITTPFIIRLLLKFRFNMRYLYCLMWLGVIFAVGIFSIIVLLIFKYFN